MIKIIIGMIFGGLLSAIFFAAQDYGYFERTYSITKTDLVNSRACTKLSPENRWFVEPATKDQVLVTMEYPLHRHQYLLDASEISNRAELTGRSTLIISDDGRLTAFKK